MKRILVGIAVTLFALAPTMGWADCDYHKASMASSTHVSKDELAQAPAASKAPTPDIAKTSATKQVKRVADSKAMSSPSKTEGSTVVAKTN